MILLAEAAVVDPGAVAESEAGWLLMGCCSWFRYLVHWSGRLVAWSGRLVAWLVGW